MNIFTVRGITQSGKTTTIEEIIKELCRRGYSVGSIKEIHFEEFAIDTEGSNTHRHKLAGSRLVAARGYHETDIFYPQKLPIEKLIGLYEDAYDYLVMEGVSDAHVPTILTAHSTEELDQRQNEWVFAVSGRIAAEKTDYKGIPCIDATANIQSLVDLIEEKTYPRLPDFPAECCSACGYGCHGLGVAIMEGKASRTDCVLSQATVQLLVDGKAIPMVPFVQGVLKNVVLGVVSELRGCPSGKSIEVQISEESI